MWTLWCVRSYKKECFKLVLVHLYGSKTYRNKRTSNMKQAANVGKITTFKKRIQLWIWVWKEEKQVEENQTVP